MENKVLVITAEEKGKRLDVYLAAALDVSRSYAQQLIQGDDVVVNDKQVKANYRLNEGDVVRAQLDVQEEYNVEPENIPLDVVYEDKDIIIVNKARGMVVHPQLETTMGPWSMPCSTTVRVNCPASMASSGRASFIGWIKIRRASWLPPRPTKLIKALPNR